VAAHGDQRREKLDQIDDQTRAREVGRKGKFILVLAVICLLALIGQAVTLLPYAGPQGKWFLRTGILVFAIGIGIVVSPFLRGVGKK
jgi:hypothetical protein